MEPQTSIAEFRALLARSTRILAVLGAGLSAASGLLTFTGRGRDSALLANTRAFADDPGLVWLFYAWCKHKALKAVPNRAHYALAELARKMGEEGFLCLSQNVDGLSPRANHPASTIRHLHGSLFDVRCVDRNCGYIEHDNLSDPPFAALSAACEDLNLADASIPVPEIPRWQIPRCPRCGPSALLRPSVVWYGETLDRHMLAGVDDWVSKDKVDIVLVVGTAATVYPAAKYALDAKKRGAVVVVVNPDRDAARHLRDDDFFFQAGADEILPELLEGVIGKMDGEGKIVDG
ncbi:DHS-like NAD/FAD-binding domain-containing protein [Astrocystis sublimbata]|nr:DHS-like NAD/FAD-binding domain-containing protein [Astrocystis sublimbata]